MAFAIFKTHCQKCGKQLGLFDGIVCSECFTNKSKSEKIPIMLYPQVDGITPTVIAVKGNFRDTWDVTKAK